MANKITYQSLIQKIAQKTERPSAFANAFVKDAIHEIRSELSAGEKINIANFGKFELHRVDEKEGINPQTQEKMRIPAHNKVVFKPYKAVRESVNEPFIDEELELLGDEEELESFSPSTNHARSKPQKPTTKNNKGAHISHTLCKKNYKSLAKWIGGGAAFLVASAGAWFYLRDDN